MLKIKAESKDLASLAYYYQESTELSNRKDYEIAKVLYEEGSYPRAFKKILPLTELNSIDKNLQIEINFLAGKILLKNNASKKALKYFRRSLSLIKEANILDNKTNYDLSLAKNYIELSRIFLDTNNPDSAKYYISKLVNIESIDNRVLRMKATAYMNLGNMYTVRDTLKVESLNLAEKYITKAINIQTDLNDNMALALSYINLASVFVEKKEYKKGKEIYGKALTYLKNEKSLKAIEYKELLYYNIAWALYNLKDYRAYEYVSDSYELRDSLNEIGLKKQYAEIQAKHNVDTVKQQAEVKRLQLERKTWIIGITGFMVSMLLLYLANLYKLRQRSLSLELSQNELKQQRRLDQLKSQSQVKILNATIDGKETERKQIAEILHDNVSALLSSASMHLQASQKQFNGHIPVELQKTQEIITEASQKIRDLSHNLMSSVLLKFGLEYAIKDVAKKFSNSDIKINTAIHNIYRYSQDCEIKIFNIVQELINNILKHSKAKNAYIIMEEEDEVLSIIVKDDGVGFKNKTEGEKGVGLNQIKARINMMNGSFLIESSQNIGTKAIIKIPVVRRKVSMYSA